MKQGALKVREKSQANVANYWRMVVPNQLSRKQKFWRKLHSVPCVGHPGFTRTLQIVEHFFYWTHMTPYVHKFVLDFPMFQVEKGSHSKPKDSSSH